MVNVAAAAVAKFPHKMVGSKLEALRQDTKVWSQGLVGQMCGTLPWATLSCADIQAKCLEARGILSVNQSQG